jgi:uncharacterized membrane-anchored protein
MAKSSVIMALITLIVMIIASVINTLCCVCSPLAAAVLGLIAGGLCVYFEKQTDPEKAMVRGAIAGTIAGAAALVGTTIGGTIALLVAGSGKTPVACLPGLCNLASAPTSQTSWILNSFFSSCFCGLIALAVMAGMGALGGRLWLWYIHRKPNIPPPAVPTQPSI